MGVEYSIPKAAAIEIHVSASAAVANAILMRRLILICDFASARKLCKSRLLIGGRSSPKVYNMVMVK